MMEIQYFLETFNLHLKKTTKNIKHDCTSYLSACEHVSCQFDLGKVALADGFEQPVVAYVGLLWLL